jgi:hypothetical protein
MLSTNVLEGRAWGVAMELEPGAALGKGRHALALFARDLPAPVIVCSFEFAPPDDKGDRVAVADALLPKCSRLAGGLVERLSPAVGIYALVKHTPQQEAR